MALPGIPVYRVRFWRTLDPGGDPELGGAPETDIASYVRSISIKHGRQFELDRHEAGTATIVLTNNDRRFDPEYAAGAYSPDVIPMKWMSVDVQDTGAVWQTLLRGHVESWRQSYSGNGKDAVVTVTVCDGLRFLSTQRITTTVASALSGSQLTAVLDAAGWPLSMRSLDVGDSTLQAHAVDDEPTLDVINRIVESEGGVFYAGYGGSLRFRSRSNYMKDATSTGILVTDAPSAVSDVEYTEITFSYDEQHIWNTVEVQARGGVAKSVSDSASEAKYLKRFKRIGDLLLTSDNESDDRARTLLARYKDPDMRVESVSFTVRQRNTDAAQNAANLLVQLFGEGLDVVRNPPGGGVAISEVMRLEGLSIVLTPDDLRATAQLSPAVLESYWILGDADLSLLGNAATGTGTTKLGY